MFNQIYIGKSRSSHSITQKHYLSKQFSSHGLPPLLQHNAHWWHHPLSWGWGCLHWKVLSSQPEKAMNRWSQILTPLWKHRSIASKPVTANQTNHTFSTLRTCCWTRCSLVNYSEQGPCSSFWHNFCQKANCITKSAFSAFFRLFHRIRLLDFQALMHTYIHVYIYNITDANICISNWFMVSFKKYLIVLKSINFVLSDYLQLVKQSLFFFFIFAATFAAEQIRKAHSRNYTSKFMQEQTNFPRM